MYKASLIFSSISIICFLGWLVIILIKKIRDKVSKDTRQGIFAFFVIFAVISSLLGAAAYSDLHYRERNKPTMEDYDCKKAEMQQLINLSTGDTIYTLVWKGRQEGER